MRKFICILFFLVLSREFALGAEEVGDSYCGNQKDFPLFECRIKNICDPYKSEKPTIKPKEYEAADDYSQLPPDGDDPIALQKAKEIYRENMGNIYKCALIQAQKNALDFLQDQLKAEKSGALDDSIGRQIELRMNRLDLSANKVGCTLSDNETIENKMNILSETSYEICKHVSYIEYLKGYYTDISKVLGTQEENVNQDYETKYTTSSVARQIQTIDAQLTAEIAHSYKIFPIVFAAYQEYESNFPIHFLLEIIYADFVLLRQKMYENIMPIAQVGYKIMNAMAK